MEIPAPQHNANAWRRVLETKGIGVQETLCVYNITRRSFLGLNVRRAGTSFARLRGLLGRARLSSDEGIWIVPSQGVHTIGLMFSIDVVYLDADGSVVHTIEHLEPFRIAPVKMKAQTVLQLAVRSIYTSRTQIGDQLRVCSAEDLPGLLEL